jgi:hypothetical protein
LELCGMMLIWLWRVFIGRHLEYVATFTLKRTGSRLHCILDHWGRHSRAALNR